MSFGDIWHFLGEVVIQLGIVGAVVIFTWQQWIKHRFDSALEDIKGKNQAAIEELRHRNNQELERYRYETNALLRRMSAVEEKEFEVLAQAWEKLQNVFPHLGPIVSLYQEAPDVASMSDVQLREFVENLPWQQSDKEQLLTLPAKSRMNFYWMRSFWYSMGAAMRASAEYYAYLRASQIFIDEELYKKLEDIAAMVHNLLTAMRLYKESSELDYRREQRKFMNEYEEIETNRAEIGALIQGLFHRREVE